MKSIALSAVSPSPFLSRRSVHAGLAGLLLTLLAAPAAAQAAPREPPEISSTAPGPALEFNVLWPLIGISELKVLIPVAGAGARRGELLTGLYADYAQVVRPDAGKVALLAGLFGYRQFLGHGLHVELSVNAGVRHEKGHPGDGATLNDLYVRAWPMAGYQHDFDAHFYANARLGAGILVYRQSHTSEERKVLPTADLNLGVRF